MKFMVTFSWRHGQENQAKAIAQFKKTGGVPPKSVEDKELVDALQRAGR